MLNVESVFINQSQASKTFVSGSHDSQLGGKIDPFIGDFDDWEFSHEVCVSLIQSIRVTRKLSV